MQVRNLIFPILLLLLIIAVYVRSIGNEFIYDDLELIVKQTSAKDWPSWRSIITDPHWHSLPYYRPLSRVTMVLQKLFHGNNPAPFHLFNILLMVCCGLVTWRLLRSKPFKFTPGHTFLSVAFFSLHPIASSCVYPICSGRESMIPGLLILISLMAWLQRGHKSYIIGCLAAVGALFSKEQAVVIPVILLAADRLLCLGKHRSWKAYVPFIICWPIYFLIRHQVLQGSHQDPVVIVLWATPFGPLQTLLYGIQTWVSPFYFLSYEPEWEIWFSTPRIGGALCILVTLVGVGIRIGTIPIRILLFWLIWIFLLMAPTANIFLQDARFAERYWWLASLGLIVLLGKGVSYGSLRKTTRVIISAMLSIILLFFTLISFNRNASFATRAQFHQDWLLSSPQSSQPHYGYADFLRDEGNMDTAKVHYQKALQLGGSHPQILNSLGALYMSLNEISEAILVFEKAVMQKPNHYLAWSNLGQCYTRIGKNQRAIYALHRALALQPKNYGTLYNLGILEKKLGRDDRAKKYFIKTLDVAPHFQNAHYSLGLLAFKQGKHQNALLHFQKIIEFDKTNANAHNAIGNVLYLLGDMDASRKAFEEAIRLDPDNVEANHNLRQDFQ